MSETKDNRFALGVNAIMAVVFILNLIYSHEDNIIMIALTGGGRLVDILSATNAAVFSGFQVHRGFRYLLCYMIISNFLGIGTFVVHFLGFLVGLMLGIFVNGSRYQHSEE